MYSFEFTFVFCNSSSRLRFVKRVNVVLRSFVRCRCFCTTWQFLLVVTKEPHTQKKKEKESEGKRREAESYSVCFRRVVVIAGMFFEQRTCSLTLTLFRFWSFCVFVNLELCEVWLGSPAILLCALDSVLKAVFRCGTLS